jgi:uncharacterized protein YwgA
MDGRLIALKLVLDELGVPADIDTIDDRKKVQKAIYLAQLAGVDLSYRFGWYLLGPYSTTLTRDYYGLAEAMSNGDNESDTHELRDIFKRKLNGIKRLFTVPSGVDLVVEDWLEALASVHYLRTVSKQNASMAVETLERVKPKLAPFATAATKELKAAKLLD